MLLSREIPKQTTRYTGWSDVDELLYAGATSKTARRHSWWSFTGWTDARGTNAPVQPSRKAKNLTPRKTNSPVDPTQHITSVGLTGDRKNFARAQKRFFSPRSLENLMIRGSNQIERSSKFVDMITKTLWTYLRKEATNHSMIWEESRNSWARTGFS